MTKDIRPRAAEPDDERTTTGRDVARHLVSAYRGRPRHDLALGLIENHAAQYGPDALPAVWHPLAQEIAALYTANDLGVMPPDDGVADPDADFYTRVDDHARRLVVLCQTEPDTRAALDTYYRLRIADTPDPAHLASWIALALANRIAESYGGQPETPTEDYEIVTVTIAPAAGNPAESPGISDDGTAGQPAPVPTQMIGRALRNLEADAKPVFVDFVDDPAGRRGDADTAPDEKTADRPSSCGSP